MRRTDRKRMVKDGEQPPLATRSSLLLRLKDLGDERSWREFYDLYWMLLYNVVRKAGFGAEDAEDVTQQTVSKVSQKMPGFVYDREKGSYKAWLMTVLRSRMADHARKNGRRVPTVSLEFEGLPAVRGRDEFKQLWNNEWNKRMVSLALERVKRRVGPKQFQIFHAYMMQEWTMREVTETLGVSNRQVYMAKYRVGEKFEEELVRLREEGAD
ncbi:MAG: sigma-70 family RNA polymerase sigma factor [Verrucomicrobia subdivision 3 bacterium]|nr:sigma-70 family RNA polymerase sigma factor [Limisphaerales bacterium]